jgi:hypothetical protein
MAWRIHQTWRWRLNGAGAAGQRGGGGEVSGRRWSVVGKTAWWSPRAVARSCSSKDEGRGEAANEVKHMAGRASSHRGGGRRRGWDKNLVQNGGFRRPGTGSTSHSKGGVDLGLR